MNITLFQYRFIPPSDVKVKGATTSRQVKLISAKKMPHDWLKLAVVCLGALTLISILLLAIQFHRNTIQVLQFENAQAKEELRTKLLSKANTVTSKDSNAIISSYNLAPSEGIQNNSFSNIPVLPELSKLSIVDESQRKVVKVNEAIVKKTPKIIENKETEIKVRKPIFKVKAISNEVQNKQVIKESTPVVTKNKEPIELPQKLF